MKPETRYKEYFDNAADIIFTVDLSGTLTSINAAGLRVSRYSLGEVINKPFIQFVATEDVELAFKMMQRKLRGDVSTTSYEIRILTKDGRKVPIEISSWLIHDSSDSAQPAGVQGIGRDVSERNHLIEQLLQSKQDEALGKLAGGVAHDFNNLLTVILGRSELLKGRVTPNHPMRAEIDFISEAAERAAVITRQLLAFSRKQKPQPVVLDLNALITKMSGWLQHLLGEHVRLTCVLDSGLKAIHADPVQMEQVILNLALNARDAMPKGGAFTIMTSNSDDCVLLSVSDSGKGMDASTLEHIFEPFYTTKGSRGFGLGLPIVHKIVALGGGSMRAESQSESGSTFKISWPSVEQLPGVIENIPEAPEGGTEAILVVDDERALLSLVCESLEGDGYTVLRAGSAEEAIRVAEDNFMTIDLLLSDIVLPNMSGLELAQYLNDLLPSLPVMFMSGYPDEVIQHHGIVNDAVNLLEKPFTRTQLSLKVREVLDSAKVHASNG